MTAGGSATQPHAGCPVAGQSAGPARDRPAARCRGIGGGRPGLESRLRRPAYAKLNMTVRVFAAAGCQHHGMTVIIMMARAAAPRRRALSRGGRGSRPGPVAAKQAAWSLRLGSSAETASVPARPDSHGRFHGGCLCTVLYGTGRRRPDLRIVQSPPLTKKIDRRRIRRLVTVLINEGENFVCNIS
jgi:hypothetical protein